MVDGGGGCESWVAGLETDRCYWNEDCADGVCLLTGTNWRICVGFSLLVVTVERRHIFTRLDSDAAGC